MYTYTFIDTQFDVVLCLFCLFVLLLCWFVHCCACSSFVCFFLCVCLFHPLLFFVFVVLIFVVCFVVVFVFLASAAPLWPMLSHDPQKGDRL